jgi:hypothetical protein
VERARIRPPLSSGQVDFDANAAELVALIKNSCDWHPREAAAPNAPPAAAPSQHGARAAASMPMKELRAHAKYLGATAAQLEEAADSDEPREALLALLAALEAKGPLPMAEAPGPAPTPTAAAAP